MATVKLITKDKVSFVVEEKIARMFGTLDTMLNSLPKSVNDNDEPIPLDMVNSSTLELIIKWCQEHVNDFTSIKNDGDTDDDEENGDEAAVHRETPAWDKKFLGELDQSTIFELIMATNFLEVKRLMIYACRKVADDLKDLSPEEVRRKYQIEDDLTEEEKEQIKKNNEWFCKN